MKKLDKRYLLVTYFLFVYGLVLGQINNNIQNQYTYKIQQEIDFISQKVQDLGIVNLKLGNINLSKVCYKGKCGLYNLSLKKWVLPLQFEKIESATDSMLVIKMDNNRARIFHLNPKSAFNLRCEYPVGAKKKFILLREGHSDSRIYFPNSKKTINLPYSFTSILDDSMIMVNNFGAVNIVDLNGVVRLKRDYRDIRIMDNKYYGGMSDHKGENKIYFELNMKKGTEYYDTIYDFNCMKLYKDKISKKYNLKLTCNSISQIIELNIDTFFYSVSQLLIGEKSGNYFLLDYLSNNRMYPFYYDAVVNKRIEYDSISISGHRSVQLFKNGKMGLIYRDIKMNLVEPKYEYIALFGFDGTHLSMRYFIKEGNKISIYNLNGDLIKICDCENPVIGSTDEPSTSNVVLCFGKNGIIKVYNINGEVISLSKVNFQDEQNDKFNITSLSDNTVVKVGKKFGLISKNKNILVPFKYNRLKKTIYKGIYIAYEEAFKEEIVSLIDINRNIKKQYKGYALMLNDNNKYFELLANRKTFYNFYIDSISLELKPLKDFAEIFNNKSIILDKAGKYGMESNDIKTIIEFKYKYGYKLQAFHLAFKNIEDKYAIFSDLGEQLTEFKYDTLLNLGFRFAAIHNDSITFYNFFQQVGNVLKKELTINGYQFIEKKSDKIIIKRNDKIGVLDERGYVYVEPEYDEIVQGASGLFIFKKERKFYLSLSLRFNDNIFKEGFDTAYIFKNYNIIYKKNNKYGIFTEDGRYTDCLFDEIYEVNKDYLTVELNSKIGLYHIGKKTFVVEPEYDGIIYKSREDVSLIKGSKISFVSILSDNK